MNEIRIYKSVWKSIRLLLLVSVFVLPCGYDIITRNLDMPPVLSWTCLCFFGLGIPIAIFNLFDKRPQVILSEQGLFIARGYKHLFVWDDIKLPYFNEIKTSSFFSSGQKFICLEIDPEALTDLRSNKTLKQISRKMGFQEVNINLGMLKKSDGEKLMKFIINMINFGDLSKHDRFKNLSLSLFGIKNI